MSLQFIFIRCCGVGLGCVEVFSHLINYKTFHPATLIPFGMLIFIYTLTIGGFKYKSSKAKKGVRHYLKPTWLSNKKTNATLRFATA